MEAETRAKLYIGIDMDECRALISFLREGEREPVSASRGKDDETFLFPTSIYAGRGGHYLYGAEAEKKKGSSTGDFYSQLYLRACDLVGTDGFEEAIARLTLFVKRLIRLRETIYQKEKFDQYLVIAVPEIHSRAAVVMDALRTALGKEICSLRCMDYAESFYYYTYHREASVWQNDVALFDFSDISVQFFLLARSAHAVPQLVRSGSREWPFPEKGETDRDAWFLSVAKEAFAKRIISGVFLLGEGFDGNWIADSKSLRFIAPNRRVFVGKNLYTKGAAYAAFEEEQPGPWPYQYDCPYKLASSVSIKVSDGGKDRLLDLARIGENWFETERGADVILKGSEEIEFYVRRRGEKQAELVRMPLEDVWGREEITRKVRIHASCPDAHTLKIRVQDLGFGVFFASTGMEWNFEIRV